MKKDIVDRAKIIASEMISHCKYILSQSVKAFNSKLVSVGKGIEIGRAVFMGKVAVAILLYHKLTTRTEQSFSFLTVY